jgi:hypothetical protein
MAAVRQLSIALITLHLAEAQMAGIGTTPSRSVVRKIRNLQTWTRHDRRGLRGGGSSLGSSPPQSGLSPNMHVGGSAIAHKLCHSMVTDHDDSVNLQG